MIINRNNSFDTLIMFKLSVYQQKVGSCNLKRENVFIYFIKNV